MREEILTRIKRIVVKVGTSILTDREQQLDKAQIKDFAKQISELWDDGYQVILVTSGAIGAGMGLLHLKARPKLLPELQAAAAVGQGRLMKFYDGFFHDYGRLSAQILLTREDIKVRQRYLNARNTLFALLEHECIPVVNENDTVSVDEIKFGDNDQLAALVSILTDADLLIILSDVDGLFIQDPDQPGKNKLVPEVQKITSRIEKVAAGTTREVSTGGMTSKIEAGKVVTGSGIPMIIANGRTKNVLRRIVRKEEVGTLFIARMEKLESRRRWIAFGGLPRGKIMVDEGAKQALMEKGKSLLSSGIIAVDGDFKTGDIVSVTDEKEKEFARGITNYESPAMMRIKGLNSSQIESALGYKYYDEVIHRDNMVILNK